MSKIISFIDFTNMSDEEKYKLLNSKDYEIEKLNNIINKIEEHFVFLKMNSTGGNKEFFEDILDFIKALQELKGSNGAIPPEVIGTNGEDGGLFDYGDR